MSHIDSLHSASNAYRIEVDYDMSLADMVRAGKYDYVNCSIVAKNIPIEGTGVVSTEVVLVHFDRCLTSGNAIKELEPMSLAPCHVEHLLALGAKYPELQRAYPILCLGPSWVRVHGYWRVPYLGYQGTRRFLSLCWVDNGLPRPCRFAAVRKSAE